MGAHRGSYLDGSDGEGDLPPSIDVRVENTENVLELLGDDQRLKKEETTSDRNLLSSGDTIFTRTGAADKHVINWGRAPEVWRRTGASATLTGPGGWGGG